MIDETKSRKTGRNARTEGAVPGEGCKDTKGTRHAEEDGVIAHLREAKVLPSKMLSKKTLNLQRLFKNNLEENAAVSVDVGPGVLGLALLLEHHGRDLQEAQQRRNNQEKKENDLVEVADEFEVGAVGQVLQTHKGEINNTFNQSINQMNITFFAKMFWLVNRGSVLRNTA